jgi:hypothetical protein
MLQQPALQQDPGLVSASLLMGPRVSIGPDVSAFANANSSDQLTNKNLVWFFASSPVRSTRQRWGCAHLGPLHIIQRL